MAAELGMDGPITWDEDDEAVANFAFAQRERFILKEERTFPQVVSSSYLQAPTGYVEAA